MVFQQMSRELELQVDILKTHEMLQALLLMMIYQHDGGAQIQVFQLYYSMISVLEMRKM